MGPHCAQTGHLRVEIRSRGIRGIQEWAFYALLYMFRPAAAFVLLSFAFRLPFVCLSFAFRLPFVLLSFCASETKRLFVFGRKSARNEKAFRFGNENAFRLRFSFARLDSAPSGVMRAYNEPPDAVPIPVRRWAASARGGRLLAARPPSTRSLATSRSLASDRSTNQRSELG